MDTMTKEEITRQLVIGIRREMPANATPPVEAYVHIRRGCEEIAENIADMDPIGQGLVIAMSIKHGAVPAGGEVAVMVEEANKLVKAMRRPLDAADENPDREKMDQGKHDKLVADIVVAMRSIMDPRSRVPSEGCMGIRRNALRLADAIIDMHPIGQQVIIAICTKRGDIPDLVGESFSAIVKEAHKVMEVMNKPLPSSTSRSGPHFT